MGSRRQPCCAYLGAECSSQTTWAGCGRTMPGTWAGRRIPAEPRGVRYPRMDTSLTAEKRCPDCDSGDYAFRSRRKIAAKPGQPEVIETRYRCKACEHEWRVRVQM